jgi:hypothetical protein
VTYGTATDVVTGLARVQRETLELAIELERLRLPDGLDKLAVRRGLRDQQIEVTFGSLPPGRIEREGLERVRRQLKLFHAELARRGRTDSRAAGPLAPVLEGKSTPSRSSSRSSTTAARSPMTVTDLLHDPPTGLPNRAKCQERLEFALQALRWMSVQIAMDDFGTGYSSLSSLSQLPLDILKIDRSFVERLDRDYEGRTIVYAIMSLANALGVRVTGEGIETARATSSLSQSPRTSWRPCSRRGTAATS